MEKNINFETALKKLEEIVSKLEEGNLPLEQSLLLFQQGIELSKLCTQKLSGISDKISILTKNPNGTMKETNFK